MGCVFCESILQARVKGAMGHAIVSFIIVKDFIMLNATPVTLLQADQYGWCPLFNSIYVEKLPPNL